MNCFIRGGVGSGQVKRGVRATPQQSGHIHFSSRDALHPLEKVLSRTATPMLSQGREHFHPMSRSPSRYRLRDRRNPRRHLSGVSRTPHLHPCAWRRGRAEDTSRTGPEFAHQSVLLLVQRGLVQLVAPAFLPWSLSCRNPERIHPEG